MKINTQYLVTDNDRLKVIAPYEMNPTEITFHNTYNDASASAEVRNVRNNSTGTSFHTAVDDFEVQQVVPFNRNAWHAGDGVSGTGNRKSIGVEICYSKSGGSRYRKAELNAIDHISDLMIRFGIPISKVKTHQERNGKYCPHRMLDEGRVAWFKNELVKAVNIKKAGGSVEAPIKEEPKLKNQIFTGGYASEGLVDIIGAMNSVHVTAKMELRSDKYVYITTDPTSEVQLNAMKGYLDRNKLWYEMV